MLGNISTLDHIYIVCGYTDMRKSIDGHCAIVQDHLEMDPTSSSLFLFCGRRRDRIKALVHKPDGFVTGLISILPISKYRERKSPRALSMESRLL